MSSDDLDPAAITPDDSPLRIEDVMASPVIRDLSTPKVAVGDVAVDFTLPELDLSSGHARETGRDFGLSAHAGHRPVALIFGSYT